MTSLLDQIRRFMTNHQCTDPGVVAVSGGADSVALLCLIAEWASPKSKLIVAYLNHQLRGQESDADEAFVENLAQQLNQQYPVPISFRRNQIDVRKTAEEQNENLEATARRLRYDWFLEVCRAERAGWVATGHTADDQAETVLFRLLRGTGLHGLTGIPAVRHLVEDVKVVRPLLGVYRSQLEVFLSERKQSFRTDATNVDAKFTRNRIRHELLPLLQANYNANIAGVLCQLAEQANATHDSIEQFARQLLEKAERPRAGTMLVFDVADLQNESPYIVCEMFRLVWQREQWPMSAMTYEHWNKLATMAKAADGECDLPGFIHVARRGRVMQLFHEPRPLGSGTGAQPLPDGRGS